MQLAEENVHDVFQECLLTPGEVDTIPVPGEGINKTVQFHPDRLASAKADIASMLSELPPEFMATGGGVWSFLNMCDTAQGEQWASLHPIMDELVMLGKATGLIDFLMPREMWSVLPGEMPYIIIKPLSDYASFH